MKGEDERFMSAALELARRGRGAVEPNPMVGAVLVRDGVELSRGWHKAFGGPHAEVEALSAARSAGTDVRGATMYVTLEPCCHHAKTPPCTDALIQAGLSCVVVAMEDPDVRVAGCGLAALRQAGIEVRTGVMEQQARELLAAYVKLRTKGRPWVICKWAQTADGQIALPPEKGRWISGPQARAYAHELRGLCDGVCVGIATVLADDPLLTNRSGAGKQPSRVVLDGQLRLPPASRLVQTAGSSPVIAATSQAAAAASPQRAEALRRAGVEVLALPADEQGVQLAALLEELGRRQWTYLLVEGGAKVLAGFVFSGLADELLAFVATIRLGAAAANLPRFDIAEVGRKLSLGEPQQQQFADDVLLRWIVSR